MERIASLARQASAGDVEATNELLTAVWPAGYRIAWSMLRERTAAEDATQEACARVLASITALRRPESFPIWFYRIVANEAKQRLRKTRHETGPSCEVASDDSAAIDERLDVRRALDSLDSALRVTVLLHYYYALNSFEIARVLSTTPVTIRWRLLVARRRLRPLLEVHAVSTSPTTTKQGYRDEHQTAR